MYYSIYPSKDATITDVEIDSDSKTGSNSGLSETLELYVLTSSSGGRGKSRALVRFDLSKISASIANGEIPSSSIEYRLKLKNAKHHQELPTSYTLETLQLTKFWDEGVGLAMYDENLQDSGYANWSNATRLVEWDSAGGDFTSSFAHSQSFDLGDEDLDLDVSDIVYSWLTGGVENNGFILKFIDAHETGSSDLFVKKFFSRHAHVAERRPRLEARWENFIQDDRENIHYGVTGSLYYYRFINGSPASIQGSLFVDVLNSSSTVVQTITASNPYPGIYHASGVFVEHTSSTQIYRDVWFTNSEQLFTGTFSPSFSTGSMFFSYDDIDLSITSLKPEYSRGEKATVNVFGKNKDYAPAVRKSGSTEPSPLVFDDAYYSILNNDTNRVIVPFSTGSNKFSKISYDKNGNYFTLWTDSFPENNVYRIKVLVKHNNQDIIFDKGWIFKVN